MTAPPRRIRSCDNATFRELAELAHSARERRRLGRSVLEGIHLCEAWLLRHGSPRIAAATSAAATHAPLRTTLRAPSVATPLGLIDEGDPVTRDVQSVFPRERLARLRHGLSLDGQPLKPARVEWQNPEQLRFVLTEGKKRQIRRMCELVGLKVIGLKRVRIGRVMLGHLPVGQWRYLAPHERF